MVRTSAPAVVVVPNYFFMHRSYLADEIYKKPVIIYNYPKEAKPFYVRLNDDGKTVAAFDIVVPKVSSYLLFKRNHERPLYQNFSIPVNPTYILNWFSS